MWGVFLCFSWQWRWPVCVDICEVKLMQNDRLRKYWHIFMSYSLISKCMCKRALLHSQRYNKCSRVGAIIMQRPCEYAVGSVGILGAPFSYLRNDFDLHRNGCKKAGCVSTVSTTTHEKDLIVVTSCVCDWRRLSLVLTKRRVHLLLSLL